jgi:hypothetical protein
MAWRSSHTLFNCGPAESGAFETTLKLADCGNEPWV